MLIIAVLAFLGLLVFVDGLLKGEVLRPLLGLGWAGFWICLGVLLVKPEWSPRFSVPAIDRLRERFRDRYLMPLLMLAATLAFGAMAFWYATMPFEDFLSGRRAWFARDLHALIGEAGTRWLHVGLCVLFSAGCAWQFFLLAPFRRED